jgi:hypothetical protein
MRASYSRDIGVIENIPWEWIKRQVSGGGTYYVDNSATASKSTTTTTDDKDKATGCSSNSNHNILTLLHSSQFPILYRYESILKQINVARTKLPVLEKQSSSTALLASSMTTLLNELDAQAKSACAKVEGGRIKLGFDYVVAAERSAGYYSDGDDDSNQDDDDDDDALAIKERFSI